MICVYYVIYYVIDFIIPSQHVIKLPVNLMSLVMSGKRQRTEGGYTNQQRRAMAISAGIRSKYPYSTYGRSYSKRGSPDSLAMYGPSFKEANTAQRASRKTYGYVGRGKYWGSALGGMAGAYLGGPMGKKAGAWIGDKASNYATKYAKKAWKGRGLYTGRGSYNSLVAGGDSSMSGAGDETEAVTFTNREYIKDVYGAPNTKFHNYGNHLNPGIETTFPWLAQVAANYEEYEFIQLVFEFKSTVNASTGGDGQTGTVIMATNYNAAESEFTDKAAMMQYHGGQSGRLTDDMVHGIECDPNKAVGDMHKYVRTDPVTDDIKSYDHGKFNFAMANIPSEFWNQQVGELWVSYKVKLLKPKLGCARMVNQGCDRFHQTGSFSFGITVGVDSQIPLLTAANGAQQFVENNLGCAIGYHDSYNTCTFPATTTGLVEVVIRFSTAIDDTATNIAESDDLSAMSISGNISGHGISKDLSLQYPSPTLVNFDNVGKPRDWTSCHTELDKNGTSDQQLRVTATFRMQLTAASGGVDNVFNFFLKNNSSSGVGLTSLTSMVEIREIKDIRSVATEDLVPLTPTTA